MTYSTIVASVGRHLLKRALDADRDVNTNAEFVTQVLLFIIFYNTKDTDHARALVDLTSAFDGMV
jgi:hypothetical protein